MRGGRETRDLVSLAGVELGISAWLGRWVALVSSPKSKQRRVPLVPGWVTAWEYGMLLAFYFYLNRGSAV